MSKKYENTENYQKNKECPFCKDEISPLTIVDSLNFRAIYNRSPVLPGHSMIIPKKHISSFTGLSPELRSEMIELSIKTIKMLQKAFNTKAFNWTIQEGAEAGQTIEHLHMHIIPRREKDLPEPGDWYPYLEKQDVGKIIDSDKRPKYSEEELKEIANNIKKFSL